MFFQNGNVAFKVMRNLIYIYINGYSNQHDSANLRNNSPPKKYQNTNTRNPYNPDEFFFQSTRLNQNPNKTFWLTRNPIILIFFILHIIMYYFVCISCG